MYISNRNITFAPCFKNNKHNCEFYILTIMYNSQINNLILNNKKYAIMFKLTIITKKGNHVTFEFGTFSALIAILVSYKECITNIDEFAQINIIMPNENR